MVVPFFENLMIAPVQLVVREVSVAGGDSDILVPRQLLSQFEIPG